MAAFPIWPGIYGFIYTGCCTDNDPPPSVKYLSLGVDSSGSASSSYERLNAPTQTKSASGSYGLSCNTDVYGNVGGSAECSSSSITAYDDTMSGGITKYSQSLSDECGGNAWIETNTVLPSLMSVWPPSISASCGTVGITFGDYLTGNQWNGTPDEINRQRIGSGPTSDTGTVDDPTHGISTRDVYTWSGQPLTVVLSDNQLLVEWDWIATYEHWQWNALGGAGGGGTLTDHIVAKQASKFKSVTTLSGPYSMTDVLNDGAAMLSAWNLGDDQQYPWRQDSRTWLVPLLERDAIPQGPNCTPVQLTGGPWSPPAPDGSGNLNYVRHGTFGVPASTQYFTGAIRGLPQPIRYARYWDFYAKNVCWTCSDGTLVINDVNWFCVQDWGGYSPGELPKTATHWTDKELGSRLTDGAYIIEFGKGVIMQKWAEMLGGDKGERGGWPSVNFARPFGRDRFLVDYTAVTADADCAGTTGVSAATYEALPEICIDPTNTALYSHRRFPSCRPIGSTINITAVQTSTGVITVTTAENHWLIAGDSLDFYNTPGLGKGVAVVTATPNTNTFTVAGTLTGSVTGAYIASAGIGQDQAKWDTTCSNHTFIVQQWWTTLRQNGGLMYAEQQGQIGKPVLPNFICLYCSPNKETFPSDSSTYSAPFGYITSEPCPDYHYYGVPAQGNEWHLKFLQAVPDPFWKAPTPCSGDTSLTVGDTFNSTQAYPCGPYEDMNGINTFYHYSYPPMVEPFLQPPAGAPALPVSLWSTFNTPAGTGVNGGFSYPIRFANNCNPPNETGGTQATAWATYIACADLQIAVHANCGTKPTLPGPGGSTVPSNQRIPGAGGNADIGGAGGGSTDGL